MKNAPKKAKIAFAIALIAWSVSFVLMLALFKIAGRAFLITNSILDVVILVLGAYCFSFEPRDVKKKERKTKKAITENEVVFWEIMDD